MIRSAYIFKYTEHEEKRYISYMCMNEWLLINIYLMSASYPLITQAKTTIQANTSKTQSNSNWFQQSASDWICMRATSSLTICLDLDLRTVTARRDDGSELYSSLELMLVAWRFNFRSGSTKFCRKNWDYLSLVLIISQQKCILS